MKRKIIRIDQEACNGCGLCAEACHEGAIGMVDGKATLLFDDHCDGLGDCLPSCPVGAITFEYREAPAYDPEAVQQRHQPSGGCPGAQAKAIQREGREERTADVPAVSRLTNWPVQIQLAPVRAPYFHNAQLLIAADCTAYAYGRFHDDLMKNRIALIGCPKLDDCDYTEKLAQIIAGNDIQSITVVRMEVPCCGGLEGAAKRALQATGKQLPWQVVTLTIDGRMLR